MFENIILSVNGSGSFVPGLKPIEIQIFPQVTGGFSPTYATIFSWIAFVGGVISVLIFIFFFARIVLASFKAISSNGDPEKLGISYKQIQANFLGALVTFLIPLALSFIGIILGFGNIFTWPKMLSSCNSAEYEFYFEAYLRVGDEADSLCF